MPARLGEDHWHRSRCARPLKSTKGLFLNPERCPLFSLFCQIFPLCYISMDIEHFVQFCRGFDQNGFPQSRLHQSRCSHCKTISQLPVLQQKDLFCLGCFKNFAWDFLLYRRSQSTNRLQISFTSVQQPICATTHPSQLVLSDLIHLCTAANNTRTRLHERSLTCELKWKAWRPPGGKPRRALTWSRGEKEWG